MSASITNSNSITEPTVIAKGLDFLAGIRGDWMVRCNEGAVNQSLVTIGPVGFSANGPQQLVVGTLVIGLNADWSYGPKNALKSVKGHYANVVGKPLAHADWPLVWTIEEPSRKFPVEVIEIRDVEETRHAIKEQRSLQSKIAKGINTEKKKEELPEAKEKPVNPAKQIEEENKRKKKEAERKMEKEEDERKAKEEAMKAEKEAKRRARKIAEKKLHLATLAIFAAKKAQKEAYDEYMRLSNEQ